MRQVRYWIHSEHYSETLLVLVKVGLRTLNLYEHSSGEKYSLGHPRSTRLGVLTMKIPEGRFFKIKTTLLMHARLHNTHITETHCGDDVTLTKT